MNYKITVFGNKGMTYKIIKYILSIGKKVDLIVSVDDTFFNTDNISGYQSLDELANHYGIEIFKVKSYSMKDEDTISFFENNRFDLAISMGWQRIIPQVILDQFVSGIFGFHGSCGYLPYGRGRSPLNWSIINGDTRVIMNLFKYDKEADSPNVFAKQIFEINAYDTISSIQCKNLICAQRMVEKLIRAYELGKISVETRSKDIDTWYPKRTPNDGKIDFLMKTREIYNLVRGVTKPFPGAFCFANGVKMIIWEAYPFDQILDFSEYAIGEIIEVFDDCFIIRTIDGSLLVKNYESEQEVLKGMVME